MFTSYAYYTFTNTNNKEHNIIMTYFFCSIIYIYLRLMKYISTIIIIIIIIYNLQLIKYYYLNISHIKIIPSEGKNPVYLFILSLK